MQEKYRNHETEQLVLLYQNTHSEDTLAEIMRRNNGLLHMWVRDYSNIPYYSEEDLLEEGYIALWRAVYNYSLGRGVTFSTYLKTVVKQHFNRIYQQATRKKRFTGQEPASYEEVAEIHRERSLEFTVLSELELKEFLSSLEGKLQYIAVHIIAGYDKVEIASLLGVTPATLTYHLGKLRSKAQCYYKINRLTA